MKTKIIQNIKSIILALILVIGVGYVSAQSWTPPTASPPGNNTDTPLNVGNSGQTKSGGLTFNTGGAVNGLIVATGNVGIGTVSPQAKLAVQDGSVLFDGTIGATPVSGGGTRFMWIPAKAALRAGSAGSSEFDDVNIGMNSLVIGRNSVANNDGSIALGDTITASGSHAVALGVNNRAVGEESVALGSVAQATNTYAVAIGNFSDASGFGAVAIGKQVTASGSNAVALGGQATAAGVSSTA